MTNYFSMDRHNSFTSLTSVFEQSCKDLSNLNTLLKTGSANSSSRPIEDAVLCDKTQFVLWNRITLMKSPFVPNCYRAKYFENGEIVITGTPTTANGRSAVVTVMQVNSAEV